jgi:hypothetical protein
MLVLLDPSMLVSVVSAQTRGSVCMGYLVLNVVSYPVVETPIRFATAHTTPGHLCVLRYSFRGLGPIFTGSLVPNVFWYPTAETLTGLRLGFNWSRGGIM